MRYQSAVLFCFCIALIGCGTDIDETQPAGPATTQSLVVFTVNYPLAYFAERIGEIAERLFQPAFQGLDRDSQIQRVAGHRPAFAAEPQVQRRADAGLPADPHGDGIPVDAGHHIAQAALQDCVEQESRVARRAAALLWAARLTMRAPRA